MELLREHRLRGFGRLARAIALVVSGFGGSFLAGQSAGEYELKAAFLYKFASFVEWPSTDVSAPICIGVLGQDPFGATLDEVVKGKTVAGRGFVVRRFRSGSLPPPCEILFVSSSEKRNLGPILGGLGRDAVLTVGDMPGFCESGGVVGLELADSRIRIRINREAADRAGLQLSSRLLQVATVVRGRGQ